MDSANTLNYSWEIVKIFFYLGVVILLIYLVTRLLRKYRNYFKEQGTLLKVIDRGFLTQRAQIALVQMRDQYYLLGITEDKITVIDTFKLSEDELQEGALIKKPARTSFTEIFKGAFRKKDGGDE